MTPSVVPLNIGNTAFMLLCASLVMLMTPGLAFFYGGLVGRKNVLAIMMQSFVSLGWTTVLWFVFGYSMCFGPTLYGIVGDPTYYAFLHGVTLHTMFAGNDAGIPLIVHVAYQMMFAIITPALITGAFANRVTFKAYFMFLTGWLVLVYFPFVHMVWSPDGILSKWGVLDFAGGIVVHNTAGFAALASVLFVGRRRVVENRPHNVPLIALGTGLLWFGWYGFNAGSELRVDAVTASAFLNTDVAASFAAVTWLFVEWSQHKQPKLVGLLTGSVAGLATITPAAGYVSLGDAALIGIIAMLRLLLRGGDEKQIAVGRRAGCVGRPRSRRLDRHRAAWGLRLPRLESLGCRWFIERRNRVFLQAMCCRGDLGYLGVYLHLRHVVADR
nr:ammonium transporter [Burkholderia sp. L27(2015)]